MLLKHNITHPWDVLSLSTKIFVMLAMCPAYISLYFSSSEHVRQ